MLTTPSLTTPTPGRRRLELRERPVETLDDFELFYFFRRYLASEHYLGCQRISAEIARREQTQKLRVSLIVDGLRDKDTGVPDLSEFNGALDAWPQAYPSLFTSWAARRFVRARELRQLLVAAGAGGAVTS